MLTRKKKKVIDEKNTTIWLVKFYKKKNRKLNF